MICVFSCTIEGIDALEVQIEIDIRTGLPSFDIVGLPGATVRESRERVRAAIINSGFEFPLQRITVNLAPADIRKDSSVFDLPIALGILAAQKLISENIFESFLIVGELSLNGNLRTIKGSLSFAELSNKHNKTLLLPASNIQEAQAISKCKAIPLNNLRQAVAFLTNQIAILPPQLQPRRLSPKLERPFAEIHGQFTAKRVLQIAAAGHHHTLLIGSPGTGKTILARNTAFIMPPMTEEEAITTSKIYSSCGKLDPKLGIMQERPFRSPHHSITRTGLIGGGQPIVPGEITLAHNGILLLDELLEFKHDALQALREPLETKEIVLSRAGQSIVFPADFLLIATANPCPCGNLGHPSKNCVCQPSDIKRYTRKLIGPLLDRIDLVAFLKPLKPDEYLSLVNEPTYTVTQRTVGIDLPLTPEAKTFLSQAVDKLHISARGYYKVIRVAKTIANLDEESEIRPAHLAEALQYRWESVRIYPD
ncbi:MAG: YifB family Mg chelatase-like AAA ATPase [Firmicutes bacterium]|nr:YifB family Mg chelatase-like AAA ATPase [Bacillota bacterium]